MLNLEMMRAESVGVVLLSKHSFIRDPAPASAAPLDLVPQFQLVVCLRNYTCDLTTNNSRPIPASRAKKSHSSTLAEFLSLGPASRATLMSTMSFLPDVDLLSHAHLGPSIMQYAEEEARVGARLMRLSKLRVVASVRRLDRECWGRKKVLPPVTPAELSYRFRSASTTMSCFLELTRWPGREGDGCAVCLEEFGSGAGERAVRLQCRHVFHRHCILNWMHQQNTCPLCRYCLPEHRHSDDH